MPSFLQQYGSKSEEQTMGNDLILPQRENEGHIFRQMMVPTPTETWVTFKLAITSTDYVEIQFFNNLKMVEIKQLAVIEKNFSKFSFKTKKSRALSNYSANQGNHPSFKLITNPYFPLPFIWEFSPRLAAFPEIATWLFFYLSKGRESHKIPVCTVLKYRD